MNNNKTLATLVVLALAMVTVPTTTAAPEDSFGSQVAFGDDDFRPTLVDETARFFCRIDFGTSGTLTDDTYYLAADTASTAAAADLSVADDTLANFDIRLTPFGSKAAGTMVGDADNAEKAANAAACGTAVYAWQDVNSDGDFTDVDHLFVGVNGLTTAVIEAATLGGTTADIWVRLTDTNGGSAGTLVKAGDADLVNYGAGAICNTGGCAGADNGFFDADNSGGLTAGDWYYITPAGITTLGLVQQYSVRLMHASFAFGSQVMSSDADFVPTMEAPPITDTAVQFCRIDFGDGTSVLDDAFYLSLITGTATQTFDIRISEYNGNAPGTLIGDADSSEKNVAGACGLAVFIWQDVDSDGDFTDADHLFVGSGGTVIAGSSDSGDQYVRLTDTNAGDAGTVVLAGQADLVNYGGGTDLAQGTTTGVDKVFVRYYDADNGNSLSGEDSVWVNVFPTGPAAAPSLPSLHAVRVLGGEFGSQVAFGDDDFVTGVSATADMDICRIDFGNTGVLTDDTFYLSLNDNSVGTFDLRLSSFGSNAAGTLVGDADNSEKGAGTCATATYVWQDVNSDGDFTDADHLFVSNGGTTLAASTTTTYFVRLTDTNGGDAGTVVLAGNADLVNYGAGAQLTGTATDFFDADNSGGFTTGDWLYVQPSGGATLPKLHAVRLHGEIAASGPGTTPTQPTQPTPTEPTPTATEPTPTATEPTPTATEPTPTATEPTPTPTEPTPETNPTPGFELIALVAALGAALVLVRRRN